MRVARKSSTQYLEQAALERAVSEYRAEGYRVSLAPKGRDRGFDFLARKGGKTLAFQVKATSSLKDSSREARRLRGVANRVGYEYRLIIAWPPRPTEVGVEGFRVALLAYLKEHFPRELRELPGRVELDEVVDVVFDEVRIDESGIRLRGSAHLETITNYDGHELHAEMDFSNDFPLRFAATLDHKLGVRGAEVEVDISAACAQGVGA
jgi:hypothetical protein